MKTISRYIMTLALLLTAVTGAWATEPRVINSEISHESLKVGDILVEGFSISGPYSTMFYFNAGRAKKGETLLTEDVKFYKGDITSVGTNAVITLYDGAYFDAAGTYTPIDENGQVANAWIVTSMNESGNSDFHLSGYKYVAPTDEPAEPAIDVKWDPATKTGNFTMPAFDVEIAPIYAPVAQWAKVDNVDQLPTAIEGVIADTDAPLIVEGTVAFAGQSTEVKQGTVMYAVTPATETQAPALDAANKWSADVPTAKLVADGGIDVLVWYYIKGADTPDGQQATEENTFNDSEPACLTVTVLSNKFDITLNAANANTIEAGKATVTVDGTAATVTDGKLQGVKMGSEVKMTAKPGYKFRKVEVKKVAPVTAITLNKTETSIKVGSTETLSVTAVAPDNATDKTYTWKTSDASKATVDQDGKVTAVAEGTVTIYAEANDGSGVKGNCTVTVTPAPALNITNPTVGQVIGSDGKNYAAASVPSGVTKVAMIAYVNGSNGLAIALADEGEMNWYNAVNTAAAHTPAFTDGTWKLPSENEWNQMKSAFNDQISGLSTAIGNAGGNGLGGTYWTSTEINSGAAKKLKCSEDRFINTSKGSGFKVRACLAF